MSKLWEAANTVIRVKFLALRLPGGSDGKKSACNAGVQIRSLGQGDPLEKGMATHCSILAWRIPWTEEPGWGGGGGGYSPWSYKESTNIRKEKSFKMN